VRAKYFIVRINKLLKEMAKGIATTGKQKIITKAIWFNYNYHQAKVNNVLIMMGLDRCDKGG
jgi:hypothetical protein